jgi:hypothetical protein
MTIEQATQETEQTMQNQTSGSESAVAGTGAPEGSGDLSDSSSTGAENDLAVDIFEALESFSENGVETENADADDLASASSSAGSPVQTQQVENTEAKAADKAAGASGAGSQGQPGEAASKQSQPNADGAKAQTAEQAAAAAAATASGTVTQQQPAEGAQSAQPPEQAAAGPQNALEAFNQALEQNRTAFTQVLADQVYKLSEEEMVELDTQPQVAVPKLLARAHINIAQNVLGTVAQQLPALVQGIQQANVQHKQMEDQFFGQFPQLDPVKDRAVVLECAKVYRAANPSADFATMAKFVGTQALIMTGKYQAPAAQAAQPATPPISNAGRFVPAATMTPAAGIPTNGNESNPWANIAQALDADFDNS